MNDSIAARPFLRWFVVSAFLILGASRCAFINALIKANPFGWQGVSCMLNTMVFKSDRDCPPIVQEQCIPPCVHGHCESFMGTDEWVANEKDYQCGRTFVALVNLPQEGGQTKPSVVRGCVAGPNGGCSFDPLGGKRLMLGFDALPAISAPPNVVSVSPEAGRLLSPRQSITVKFDQTMDATSVILSSDMAAEASPYAFSRSPDQFFFNDTLTVPSADKWQPGRRTLTIDLKDDTGKPSQIRASWFVLAPGQAASPDFNSCVGGCEGRHFEPFSTVFTASGGFPPYLWRIADGSPPASLNREVFEHTGVFAGAPTFCINCKFDFTVCVTDLAKSETCHPVFWRSGL